MTSKTTWADVLSALNSSAPMDLLFYLRDRYAPGNANHERTNIVYNVISPARDWRQVGPMEELLAHIEKFNDGGATYSEVAIKLRSLLGKSGSAYPKGPTLPRDMPASKALVPVAPDNSRGLPQETLDTPVPSGPALPSFWPSIDQEASRYRQVSDLTGNAVVKKVLFCLPNNVVDYLNQCYFPGAANVYQLTSLFGEGAWTVPDCQKLLGYLEGYNHGCLRQNSGVALLQEWLTEKLIAASALPRQEAPPIAKSAKQVVKRLVGHLPLEVHEHLSSLYCPRSRSQRAFAEYCQQREWDYFDCLMLLRVLQNYKHGALQEHIYVAELREVIQELHGPGLIPYFNAL